jgi:hypothetical protein
MYPIIFTRSQLGVLLKLLLYTLVEAPISAQLKKASRGAIFCIRESFDCPISFIEHVRLLLGGGVCVCSLTARLIVHDISLSAKIVSGLPFYTRREERVKQNRIGVTEVVYATRQIKSMPEEIVSRQMRHRRVNFTKDVSI